MLGTGTTVPGAVVSTRPLSGAGVTAAGAAPVGAGAAPAPMVPAPNAPMSTASDAMSAFRPMLPPQGPARPAADASRSVAGARQGRVSLRQGGRGWRPEPSGVLELAALGEHALGVADVEEGLLGRVVELALDDGVEGLDRLLHRHVDARQTGE